MTRLHPYTVIASVLLLVATASPLAQQPDTIDDRDVNRLASFVDMPYPLVARAARIQGVVVVRVGFDENGRVTTAAGVSGARALVDASLENVKKWTFKPRSGKTAVIVYDFSIDGGACHDDSNSAFRLRHWNAASITICSSIIVG
jgi:TonB family protein